MASTVTLSELRATLPTSDKTVCQKLLAVPEHIDLVAEDVAWMFTDAGALSSDLQAMICALSCFAPPALPAPDVCADILLVGSVVSGNHYNSVRFRAGAMTAGYNWTLQQSPDAAAWSDLASGITTGSEITYKHENLANGTAVYYQMTVSKTGCPAIDPAETSGTPSGCDAPNVTLTITSPAARTARLTLTGLPETGWTVWIYSSTDPRQFGSQVVLATVGDYSYEDSSLNETLTYYYLVQVQEPSGECPPLPGVRGSVRPMAPAVTAPAAQLSGHVVSWANVDGAVKYRVYRKATYQDSFAYVHVRDVAAGSGGESSFSIVAGDWPANYPFYGTRTRRSYHISVVSVNAAGAESPHSSAPITFLEEV